MPTYICTNPECKARTVIAMEVSVSVGGGQPVHKCSKCGSDMEKEG